MKIAIAQVNVILGDLEKNTEKIIHYIQKAKNKNADLIVFPELTLTGYPPTDLFEYATFIHQVERKILEISTHTDGISVIVGAPSRNSHPKGKPLYNSAYILEDCKIKDIIHKTLLPAYDVFDEPRYFESNTDFHCVEIKGKKLALVICEDSWDRMPPFLYSVSPLQELVKHSPDFIVNITASPFSIHHAESRKKMLMDNAVFYALPMIYVNHIGAQTDLIFDGGSMVYNQDGMLCEELNYLQEELRIIDMDKLRPSNIHQMNQDEKLFNALVLGIKDYFHKMGFRKAVLGLSGGIDSAVTAVLACEALGSENITGLLMPSVYSSQHSIDDAMQLVHQLKMNHYLVPVESSFQAVKDVLKPVFEGMKEDITEENLQARIRALYLMAYSNKTGSLLLNTSNKSEAAVGYGTLYGDMSGAISVLGDLYKTQVYALANYINREKEIIPLNTISKPPSAELRPGQKDTDALPPYDVLDPLIKDYLEERLSPDQLISKGHNPEMVKKIVRLINMNEYKRKQAPPSLRISSKAFGKGRQMAVVGKNLE
jgi:NAD+ synthase (glutamine-hydrolysing)